MNDRNLARLGVPPALAYLALTVIGLVLAWRNDGGLTYVVPPLAGLTAFAIVGSVLVSRRPRNPVSWLFLSASLAGAAFTACIELATYGAVTAPGSISFVPIAAWLVGWFEAAFFMLLVFSIFLFPTGSLPSHKWRPVVVGVGLWGLVLTALLEFGSADLGPSHITNPLFLPALLPLVGVASNFLLFLLCLAVAVASLVARHRAGSAAEKQQLKWILPAAVLMVASLVAPIVVPQLGGAATFVAILVLPAAMAIAILRHQLYDIDHLINRTLVYGGSSGVIAVLFFAPIVGIQPLLRPLTSGSELAVAVSTLVAFALFQPIRRRVQAAVDRRFDRSRYDAARTLDAFSDKVRDEVDLAKVEADLLTAVSTTMAPQHLSLWLRKGLL